MKTQDFKNLDIPLLIPLELPIKGEFKVDGLSLWLLVLISCKSLS